MLGKIEGRRRRDDRVWVSWMASPTQWTWVCVNFGSWWWAGRPGVLCFMGLQRIRHDWVTELNWYIISESESCSVVSDSLQLYSPWNSSGQSTGVGSRFLLQGIFQSRDWTQVSHTAGRFFTSWAIREAHIMSSFQQKLTRGGKRQNKMECWLVRVFCTFTTLSHMVTICLQRLYK